MILIVSEFMKHGYGSIAMTDIFAGTSGPHNASIAIVGESYGSDEAYLQQPFVGRSGQENDKILSECGLSRDSIFCTNVINSQPWKNEMWRFFHPTQEARALGKTLIRGLYPQDNVILGLEKVRQQLAIVQPDIVIGYGNYALWALTEDDFKIGDKDKRKVPTGIGAWRGSQLYCRPDMGGFPLLPTYHPAAALRTWPWRTLIKHDLSQRLPKAFEYGGWQEPKRDFIIRPSFDQTMKYIVNLAVMLKTSPTPTEVSCDLETRNGHIACCGLGYDDASSDAICIPFMCAENPEGYFTLDEEAMIVTNLCYILTHPNIRLIGQNFLYDAQYFAKWWGITVKCFFDTMLMHHLCWPGTPMGLGHLSSLYCDYHCYWKDEGDIGEDKEWGKDVPEEQLWEYNCKDVINTTEVKYELVTVIKDCGLEAQAAIQMAQFPMLLEMQLRGTLINTDMRARLSMDLVAAVDSRREWLRHIIGEDVMPTKPKASCWTGSPKQQGELFYDLLAVRPPKGRSMDDDALERIGKINPILTPITQTIQEMRSLRTFNSNFCKARLDLDKRLRCSYNPTAKTFRYKSSRNAFGTGTNLMNIPEGREED
ncbi:hypothetical protein LCGC14_0389420 [marine sediment metagenome]|uniref:3'-5' exonuclease domain-containing protein n=1 Tax=marine sediment metagenome TaxID=412755 RepID=A0A0F9SZZ9_9ZZZZ